MPKCIWKRVRRSHVCPLSRSLGWLIQKKFHFNRMKFVFVLIKYAEKDLLRHQTGFVETFEREKCVNFIFKVKF